MKKRFWNGAVFATVMLFLGFGLFGKWIPEIRQEKQKAASERVTGIVERVLEQKLLYHDQLINWNSLKENLLGTRIVEKPDTLVVKTESGKLAGDIQESRITEEEVSESVAYVELIREIAKNAGADFLCCIVPPKTTYETTPVNIRDFRPENQEEIIFRLRSEDIPILEYKTAFHEKKLADEDLFFVSDHHWKPLTGFFANQATCEALAEIYGFAFDRDLADILNYDVETYPDWFLGSYGKKTGLYFTWKGADDFDVIVPKFPTDLTEEIPAENLVRRGSFRDTMLHSEYMKKDYYGENPYTAYSGGDYRLQIIRNNLLPDGPRIAVVRSSYSCVITPFLALQAGELHVMDDREGSYPPGDPIDLASYFQTLRPDYVILIKQL